MLTPYTIMILNMLLPSTVLVLILLIFFPEACRGQRQWCATTDEAGQGGPVPFHVAGASPPCKPGQHKQRGKCDPGKCDPGYKEDEA